MKTKRFTILSLTGLFMFISTADISAQKDFEDFEDVVNHAVFSWGEPGEWDDGLVWNPAVIKDGDTLRMYYTGGNEIVWDSPNSSIGYAWSLDGIEWTRYLSNPILVPINGWYLFGCAVIKDDDIYKMWYGRVSSPGLPGTKIGYATSDDAINWTKQSSNVLTVGIQNDWDVGHITPQTVIKEGDTYKMWYWATRPEFPWEQSMPQSGLATSTDGINWTKYDDPATTEAPFVFSDPVLKVGGPGTWDEHRALSPMVVKSGSGYEIFYVGVSATTSGAGHTVGYAKSGDGIHWDKYPDPVISDPRTWGNTNYGGTVLAFDNKFHLWYACFHTSVQAGPKIGYATSPNPTGIASQSMEANVQLYPNPFSDATTISYELQHSSTVQITIYNHIGEQIEVIEQNQSLGKKQLDWNAEVLPAGVYFCVLKTEYGTQTVKMIKLK